MATIEGVNLARQPMIRIGQILIEPGLRRARNGEREQTLEPLVLQVLLALHGANGAILSRKELLDRCWGGRVLSDDAVDRVIARIRRLGNDLAAGSFTVETIPKVGYRLALSADEIAADLHRPDLSDLSVGLRSPLRRWAIGGVSFLAILFGAMGVIGMTRSDGAHSSTATVAIVSEVDAGQIAQELASDLLRVQGSQAADFTLLDASVADRADLQVRLGFERDDEGARADVVLVDLRRGELLWSTRTRHSSPDLAQLRQEFAGRIGHVLRCATSGSAAIEANVAALRLYLNACGMMIDEPDYRRIEVLRRLTDLAPGFAPGWAELGWSEARLASLEWPRESRSITALRTSADAHLERAAALDPRSGIILAARAEMTDPRHFRQRLVLQERGLAADPQNSRLHALHAQSLQDVGRIRDAIFHARQAVSLDPLSPLHRSNLVLVLAYGGLFGQAMRELRAMEELWPESAITLDTRFRVHFRYGDPAVARRLVESGSIAEFAGWREYLRARDDPTPANVNSAIAASLRLSGGAEPLALQMLGEFGEVDAAYAMVRSDEAVENLRFAPEILFRPQMQSFRRDRRFPDLMRRLGILQFWRSTGRWPDLCADGNLAYRCIDLANAA